MLKPRPLPPAHENQLFVPVKCFGFFEDNDDDNGQPPPAFRERRTARRKRRPYRAGRSKIIDVGSASLQRTPREEGGEGGEEERNSCSPSCKETISPRSSMTSMIHVRGRASLTDVNAAVIPSDDVRQLNEPSSPDGRLRNADGADDGDDNRTSLGETYLPEGPTSSRTFDGRSPVFSPILECSKYNVIGEPHFRKKRTRASVWRLPKIPFSTVEPLGHGYHKTNAIDVRSIYGDTSKLNQVPRGEREDTVILPPLDIGQRRRDASLSVDFSCLAEKRLVQDSQARRHAYRQSLQDHAPLPSAYNHYFRLRHRRRRFVQSVFRPDDFWESHARPVHCARCRHQSEDTLHFCDVLGRRFCRFCSERSTRLFSDVYEKSRLLVASPNKSPTLKMAARPPSSSDPERERELSFVGVRKVIITKTAQCHNQGEGRGRDRVEG